MTYCLYALISLCLIILQTTVMPCFLLFDSFYDLLIPLVLYLGIFRPSGEGIVVILFLGLVMDNLSSGPFGLYGTSYLWLFIGTRWVVTFLHVANHFLLPFVVALGVLLENLIALGVFALLTDSRFPDDVAATVGMQVMWATFTGAFFLIFLKYLQKRWDHHVGRLFVKKNGDT